MIVPAPRQNVVSCVAFLAREALVTDQTQQRSIGHQFQTRLSFLVDLQCQAVLDEDLQTLNDPMSLLERFL